MVWRRDELRTVTGANDAAEPNKVAEPDITNDAADDIAEAEPADAPKVSLSRRLDLAAFAEAKDAVTDD